MPRSPRYEILNPHSDDNPAQTALTIADVTRKDVASRYSCVASIEELQYFEKVVEL